MNSSSRAADVSGVKSIEDATFVTQFGRQIRLIPGHIDLVRRTVGLIESPPSDWQTASINVAGGHQNLDYEQVNSKLQTHTTSLSLGGYAARLNRTYQFINLLRNTNVRPRFDKSLDIGCGFAIQPRVLRARGIVKEAVAIDIYDRASAIDERMLGRQHRQLRRLRFLDAMLERIDESPIHSLTRIQRIIKDNVASPRLRYKYGTGWFPDVGVFRLQFVAPPRLDRYINGDVYDLQERFDLITSFSSLEWFEANSIFGKISDLLVKEGIFYLWVPNWWCAINTTTLAGHFPWACQRLTKADFFRYLDEFHASAAGAMKVAYSYFDPGHPTLADYIDIGYKHGLMALDYKSNLIPELVNRGRGITSLGWLRSDHDAVEGVLADIQEFRPDIRLNDLMAHSHAIVFQKVDRASTVDRIDAEKMLPGETRYVPSNPVFRRVGRFSRRVLKGAIKGLQWR